MLGGEGEILNLDQEKSAQESLSVKQQRGSEATPLLDHRRTVDFTLAQDRTINTMNPGDSRAKRKHGFQWPWSGPQVSSILIYIFNIVALVIVDRQLITSNSIVLVGSIFLSLLNVIILVLAIWVTLTDSTDPKVLF